MTFEENEEVKYTAENINQLEYIKEHGCDYVRCSICTADKEKCKKEERYIAELLLENNRLKTQIEKMKCYMNCNKHNSGCGFYETDIACPCQNWELKQ